MTTVLTVMMSQLNNPLYVLCELQVFSLVIQGVGGGGERGGGGGGGEV